jgi:ribosomal protein S18 acetylase RimI-like enzyme
LGRVIIRKASASDILSIVQACLTSASEEETEGFAAPEWVTYSSAEELKKVWKTGNTLKDGSEVVVAEKEGRIVGFIVFKVERDHVYIDDIDVTRDEQRKGIGKALVGHVESLALANGYSSIKTDTTENAQGVPWNSYGFWTKMGFKDTGERLPTKWSFKTIPFVKRLK